MTVKEAEKRIVELMEEASLPASAETLISEVDQSEEDIKRAIPKLVDEGELAITDGWRYRLREENESNYR